MPPVIRPFILFLAALPCLGATFGTVVERPGLHSDMVVDEARKRLYILDSGDSASQVAVYSIASRTPTPGVSISVGANAISMAMSRSGQFLYVACFSSASVDIIDLNKQAKVGSINLPANPQALAVGFDERVLISTSGTPQGQNILTVYDPNPNSVTPLQSVVIAPPAPTAPQVPPPNGNGFLSGKARLQATPDGKTIVGVHELANNTRYVFIYDAASSTVLRSRNFGVISPILAISPDASRFLSGPTLFDSQSLLVLGQQNAINAPYTFSGTPNFNVQTAQGGAVFSPDGARLYAAYNIVPVALPAAKANTAQLVVNTPDNLMIQLGLQLPENLNGKMIITSDGATIYALSQSGFIVLPIGTLQQTSPIAVPDSSVALLATDQCGVTASQNTAVIPVRNVGSGSMTVSAQLPATTTTSSQVSAAARPYGGDVTARLNAAVSRTLGTAAPDTVLLQSTQAVNIIPSVRVFQNNRNSEQTGAIIPMDIGATTTGLTDMLADAGRQRLYIANPALNRIEVFDMQQKKFLAPVNVGQLPRSIAFGNDTNTLYVANSGAESLSIVDLNKLEVSGRVDMPPLPFNSTIGLITPTLVASSQRDAHVIMSNGSIWKIVGNTVIPRKLNTQVFGTATTLPAPQTMASSQDGSSTVVLAGNGSVYLYSAAADDFIAVRTVITTPTGYFGPIAAGPSGQYFVIDDQIVNSALTVQASGTGTRPVAAVAAVGAQSFLRFSTPLRANVATAPSDAGLVELVDVATQRTLASAVSLEGPLTAAVGTARTIAPGRLLALDPSGTTAYMITASGLTVIPMTPASTAAPQISPGAAVSAANLQTRIAPGGLISIFGRNLAATATSSANPLPTILGGTCVTLNNLPIPLLATSAGQINAQIPPTLAAGNYPLVIRSLTNSLASNTVTTTVSKYAPAIFVDANGAAIFHKNGDRVDKDHPASRDEPLTIYATGLGVTTGGKVTAGVPSPSNPLAVTAAVLLYFGNPTISDSGVIIDWSGLMPGGIGVYQINGRVPGTHLRGEGLPVTLKIGGVSSPTTGANVPLVWVN